MADQLFALNRDRDDRATSYTCALTTDKLSAVIYNPLSYSRHNDGDRSAKVGHEISTNFGWDTREC